jgi:hypothetical protein
MIHYFFTYEFICASIFNILKYKKIGLTNFNHLGFYFNFVILFIFEEKTLVLHLRKLFYI